MIKTNACLWRGSAICQRVLWHAVWNKITISNFIYIIVNLIYTVSCWTDMFISLLNPLQNVHTQWSIESETNRYACSHVIQEHTCISNQSLCRFCGNAFLRFPYYSKRPLFCFLCYMRTIRLTNHFFLFPCFFLFVCF